MKVKIWAVEHRYGLSLFRAKTAEGAFKKAKKQYGESGGPYVLAKNQEQDIAYAQSFNAIVF